MVLSGRLSTGCGVRDTLGRMNTADFHAEPSFRQPQLAAHEVNGLTQRSRDFFRGETAEITHLNNLCLDGIHFFELLQSIIYCQHGSARLSRPIRNVSKPYLLSGGTLLSSSLASRVD